MKKVVRDLLSLRYILSHGLMIRLISDIILLSDLKSVTKLECNVDSCDILM